MCYRIDCSLSTKGFSVIVELLADSCDVFKTGTNGTGMGWVQDKFLGEEWEWGWIVIPMFSNFHLAVFWSSELSDEITS